MKGNKHMKTITNIIHPLFALFAFACFALSPQMQAVCQHGCDTGNNNTFLGNDALINNTTGQENTANGAFALSGNTTGVENTSCGWNTLHDNTTGGYNTAVGSQALRFYNGAGINTAVGHAALGEDTTGSSNTAIGEVALFNNTTGNANTAIGEGALVNNTTSSENTAVGSAALTDNPPGDYNTAVGSQALRMTTGTVNTAVGHAALLNDTAGSFNTAIGDAALLNNTTGSGNIALGDSAGFNLTTGDFNIDIGNLGVVAESNTIRIGTVGTQTRTFIAGISGTAVSGGVPVRVNSSGKLGTAPSSERFKEAMKPMDKASKAIFALKPVTFRYKKEIDPDRIPQFGLVAEQVEKVNPDLVAWDEQGKPFTVRYEAVNAMLLNEFLKEHRKGQEQDRNAQEQQKEIDALKAELKEQRSLIQKVSAQLELSSAAPQTVLNN